MTIVKDHRMPQFVNWCDIESLITGKAVKYFFININSVVNIVTDLLNFLFNITTVNGRDALFK